MKSKDLQPRLLCPAKLSFRIEGKIKYFPDKVNLKEFINTKPLLCEMLKGLIKKKKQFKTMNIKMVISSQLSTIESEKQTKQQAEQTQNHRHGDHLEGHQLERGKGKNGGKGTGNKKHIW